MMCCEAALGVAGSLQKKYGVAISAAKLRESIIPGSRRWREMLAHDVYVAIHGLTAGTLLYNIVDASRAAAAARLSGRRSARMAYLFHAS